MSQSLPSPSHAVPSSPSLQAEQAAVVAAQAGDLAALAPILAAHAKLLFSAVVLPRTGNAAIAQDIVRDTLTTAIEKLGLFQWQGKSMFPWLRQIAINKVFDWHRSHQRSKRLADALAAEPLPEPARPDAAMWAEQERKQNRARIDEALGQLPDRYRQVIELRLIHELPREACAQQLAISTATFDVLLHRAIRAFRKVFGPRPLEQL